MDLDKIEELIGALEGSQASELTVRAGDASVKIRRGAPKPAPVPVVARPRSAEAVEESEELPGEALVRAPMVGLFHSVDGLAQVGAQISAGQVVGSIESMKLLNDIIADVSGEVVESLIEDGTPVEYNQVLCRIKLS